MSSGFTSKIKEILFGNRPNIASRSDIAELTILLPEFDMDSEPLLALEFKKKKSIHFACPTNSTILDIKIRIRGVYKIPSERIVLFYLGAVQDDKDFVPEDAYDQDLTENSDDDIFRPRLFLHVVPEEKEEEEKSEKSLDGEESQVSFFAESEEADPDIFDILAESNKGGGKDSHLPTRSFNLILNLEKIKCDRYADALIKAGFEDEGSFSFLTDEIMRESPLFIPRVARVRIMALADATRRRIFKDQEMQQSTEKAQLETELLDGDKIKTKQVDGLEGEYTTKAGMKQAWAMKLKAEEKESKQQYEEYLVAMRRAYEEKRKDLPDGVYARIREVAAQCRRDDVDCLVEVAIPTESHWCCDAHGCECLKVRDATTEMRSLTMQAELQTAVDRIDFYNMGVVARYQLELILNKQLTSLRLEEAMSAEDKKALLDSCVMSEDEQQWQREWCSQVARENPLTDLPLRAYSAKAFVVRATEALLALELKRLFNKPFDHEDYFEDD